MWESQYRAFRLSHGVLREGGDGSTRSRTGMLARCHSACVRAGLLTMYCFLLAPRHTLDPPRRPPDGSTEQDPSRQHAIRKSRFGALFPFL